MANKKYTGNDFKGYVYLKYYNYLKYRTSTPSNALSESANRVLKIRLEAEKQRIESKAMAFDYQQLEDYLNSFFPHSPTTLQTKMSENTKKIITNFMISQLEQKIPGAFMNTATLAGYSQKADALKTDVEQTVTKIQDYDSHYYQVWLRRVRELTTLLSNTHFSDKEHKATVEAKAKRVQQCWAEVQKYFGGIGNKKIVQTNQTFATFKKEFNELMDMFLLSSDTQALKIIGESFVAAGLYAFFNQTAKGTKKVYQDIEKMLTGLESSQKGISVTNRRQFSDSEWFDIFGGKADVSNINNGVFNINSSQNKTDVLYKVPIGGEEIRVSVKNYNLSNNGHNVHFVSGSDLLTMTSADDDFVSHYLNVTSQHGYYSNEKNKMEPSGAMLAFAHHSMKKLLLMRAIVGGLFEKHNDVTGYSNTADVLIVNDNSRGKIKVYSTWALIATVIKDLSNIIVADTVKNSRTKVEYPGYPSDAFQYSISGWQSWPWDPAHGGDLGRRRMLNLYKQMRQIKISIGVKSKVFKEQLAKQKK